MEAAYPRHDIPDHVWKILEPQLSGHGLNGAQIKLRYLVENAFFALKRWRGIVTRYACFFFPCRRAYPLYRYLSEHLLTILSHI